MQFPLQKSLQSHILHLLKSICRFRFSKNPSIAHTRYIIYINEALKGPIRDRFFITSTEIHMYILPIHQKKVPKVSQNVERLRLHPRRSKSLSKCRKGSSVIVT